MTTTLESAYQDTTGTICRLLNLPAELRVMIWERYFSWNHRILVKVPDAKESSKPPEYQTASPRPGSAIVRTCSLTYSEALPILHARTAMIPLAYEYSNLDSRRSRPMPMSTVRKLISHVARVEISIMLKRNGEMEDPFALFWVLQRIGNVEESKELVFKIIASKALRDPSFTVVTKKVHAAAKVFVQVAGKEKQPLAEVLERMKRQLRTV